MSSDPPPSAWQSQEGNPISSVHSDVIHDSPVDQKPDSGRTSGSRRSGRKKDEDDVKADKKDTNGKSSKKDKEPRPRNRRPREKSTTAVPMSNSRKKPKLESPEAPAEAAPTAAPAPGPAPPRSPQTTPNLSGSAMPPDHQQPQHHPYSLPTSVAHPHPHSSPQPSTFPYSNPPPSSSYPPVHSYSASQPPQLPPPQPQRTSGQNYDPIRSAFDTSSPGPTPLAVTPPAHLSPNHYRASASPSINSIIDPPDHTSQSINDPIPRPSTGHTMTMSTSKGPSMPLSSTSRPPVSSPMPTPPPHGPLGGPLQLPPSAQQPPQQQPYSYHPQWSSQGLQSPAQQQQQPQPQEQKPQHEFSAPSQPSETQLQSEQPVQPQPQSVSSTQPPMAMDVDTDKATQPSATDSPAALKKEKASTNTPTSKAPSPHPPRAKDAAMLPQGSGLISNALFGKDDSHESPDPSNTTPNIILHVPLQGTGNRIINFARLAEEQYGFAALHPRLAAHREQLARVAAAGAALEKNGKGGKGIEAESADEDLSLDVERDSELDGDAAMGGMGSGAAANTNGAAGTEEGDGKKRRRRKKVEEYDRDDPFVDDSELVWQEQAAASKDGFFVYSGPLVPEGDKVQVERADGTIKRGRGRGRGGRGRGSTTTPQQPLAAAPVSQANGLPLRGPGSRGGTSRRPRGSKKQETNERDRPIMKATPAKGGAGRGGGSATRGGKTVTSSTTSMPAELAPAPTSKPNLAPSFQASGSLASPELTMKQ